MEVLIESDVNINFHKTANTQINSISKNMLLFNVFVRLKVMAFV